MWSRRALRRLAPALACLAFLGAALPALSAGAARAAMPGDPADFLIALKDRAIEQLTDESVPEAQRRERFRVLFKNHFDLASIGRFVLGRYWRQAEPTVREDFLSAFEDVLVQRFAPMFAGYADTKFQIDDVRPLKDENQVVVSSTIQPPEGEPVRVDWRIREKDGRHQILDVIGEGVSMALTLRSEYASAIKSSGGRVEDLIMQLRTRVGSEHDPQTSKNVAN